MTRWQKLCETLGIVRDIDTFSSLRSAYKESHRHYHTAFHVNECLGWFDEVSAFAVQPALVETALWFHDAVYRPARKDNEAASARWACRWLLQHGVSSSAADEVGFAIKATAMHPLLSGDAALVMDIDLAILAAPPERFEEYESQLREEYGWVPEFIFSRRREELLRMLLERERIYSTPYFLERFEHRARANLHDALQRLGT